MKSVLLIVLIGLQFWGYSQKKIKVKSLALLPAELYESSGMVAGKDTTVWTHNDSGGEPILYQLNDKAEIIRTVRLLMVNNVDWEDMANDYAGYVYIADIGNNNNSRTDLSILKIPHPDSLRVDSVLPELIKFKYENQSHFPPSSDQLNFDAEALIAYEDSLFIFTKNRTKPYSKYTYVYGLANKAGHQVAVLRDSLYLGKTKKYLSWVTAATRHTQMDLVVLLSHKKAWCIKNFRASKAFQIIPTKIAGLYSQKEALAFDLNNNLWITNEKFKLLRAKLKKGRLSKKTVTFAPY